MSEPFNPLDKVHLAESIERALLDRPCEPLPPDSFLGAGVYAIYYSGAYGLYQPISAAGCTGEPIYVGKAVPSGSRRGGFLTAVPATNLLSRLAEHADSIRAHQAWGEASGSDHLRLSDFSCRYLPLDDIWIPLGEAILISTFQPVWNTILDGFGKHASGAGRMQGRRSLWDELHPGREWALREQDARLDRPAIEAAVTAHLNERKTSAGWEVDTGQLEGAVAEVLSDEPTATET